MSNGTGAAFREPPYEIVDRYEGCTLLGRFLPETEDRHDAAYQIEVHRQGAVWFWAEVYLPRAADERPRTEERLLEHALVYARTLIDEEVPRRDEPYRREVA